MKHTEKKLKAAVLLLLLTCSSVFAQNMDELGVVWDRTYGTGYINSLKPVIAVAGGHGYVAAGWEWNSATPPGIDRCAGLLIEIDESGNEIRRATATIPQAYITAHNNNLARAEAEFVFAFKTSDGGYLAFGVLGDFNAPGSEKEWGWGTNSIDASGALTNGVWIVKFNSQLQIVSNTLVRGRAPYVGEQLSDGRVVIGGYPQKTDI
ncbi:hypothetical protein AGMMS49574_10420 [Bacteroidia bacterium]|nr:hypothetical protein AGMMS49574_10420 [Bacteroidia bacterium]